PEVGEAEVDIEFQQIDAARAFRHGKSVRKGSDGTDAQLALAGWERSISGRLEFPRVRARRQRSNCSRSAATPPARSTSRARSGRASWRATAEEREAGVAAHKRRNQHGGG